MCEQENINSIPYFYYDIIAAYFRTFLKMFSK